MLQITEDTPVDMLAGAMDLTVHLPNARPIKMSVERSTPMMDLLVQITTNNQLQHSGYILQPLGMAPSSSELGDKILPYKPNTPIGVLNTQHIKLIPKARTLPATNKTSVHHQPFESTFRLKVHLPRNQLYVTRVSQNVLLEDIMKKVCEEKNLDPIKYEFKHPGNLDEILDPKLTLSDCQITEIYVVPAGATSLNQVFSNSDYIAAIKKEEERKQMHNKTGGGVFNLIFRRGKSSMGSGSVSSDNRSISPTHSDDSRSVTPPAQPPLMTPSKIDPPKPPQRKRRPAPKPPQVVEENNRKNSDSLEKTGENNGLTICHSRNSSDSSGYHEASILSDNCNTSLPRRPVSVFIVSDGEKMKEISRSSSNLTRMESQSKSTSSLAFAGRKKKAAPKPPSATSVADLATPSPVVASQPLPMIEQESQQDNVDLPITNPKPAPRRNRSAAPPVPRPRAASLLQLGKSGEKTKNIEEIGESRLVDLDPKVEEISSIIGKEEDILLGEHLVDPTPKEESVFALDQKGAQAKIPADIFLTEEIEPKPDRPKDLPLKNLIHPEEPKGPSGLTPSEEDYFLKDLIPLNYQKEAKPKTFPPTPDTPKEEPSLPDAEPNKTEFPPKIVDVYPKTKPRKESKYDTFSKRQNFQIGKSLVESNFSSDSSKKTDLSAGSSVASALGAFNFVDEIMDVDENMFTGNSKHPQRLNQSTSYEYDSFTKNTSANSLRSMNSLPGFVSGNMKKWDNLEQLDGISSAGSSGDACNKWVVGDTSDSESLASINPSHLDSIVSTVSEIQPPKPAEEEVATKIPVEIPKPKPVEPEVEKELHDLDWHYQLPSPPKAFRDSSPTNFTSSESRSSQLPKEDQSNKDSVVTSPELFEKLKAIEDHQSSVSDLQSVVSADETKDIYNKLSLENLEKRKSLVYNRELATSLKMTDLEAKQDTFSSSLNTFETTYNEVRRSSGGTQPYVKNASKTSTLPNFKITTYDNPKQNIKVFEDDTIRSNSSEAARNVFEVRREMLSKSYMGRSMENISVRKSSLDNVDGEIKKVVYRPKTSILPSRSESFSSDLHYASKPVSRSKSHLTLNKYSKESELSKSNSLYDISGLQSLEVMRMIQNKLNTPTSSVENLEQPAPPPQKKEEKVKPFQYQRPSINMSTWSERPKIPVSVKEDADYNTSSKLIVNTTNNQVTSNNTFETKNTSKTNLNGLNNNNNEVDTKNVSIKVNGTEAISRQHSGNVVIKIGAQNQTSKIIDNQRFITHTTPVGYRKPFTDINSTLRKQRPHSIALDSSVDISRVPVVRSLELKKPYKDYPNTSITQIYQGGDNEFAQKPKFSSFIKAAPTVRGFGTTAPPPPTNNSNNNRYSWAPSSYSTLPAKPKEKEFYSTNRDVPFSQSNLRRTESNKIANNDFVSQRNSFNSLPPVEKKVTMQAPPPPPPAPAPPLVMKKVRQLPPIEADPRDQLLSTIRGFGGKKGLKSTKS